MAHLVLSLLGGFQAAIDDRPLTGFESNKVRALLAYLAVEADRPHRRESLAALLWPEFPEAAALANLRVALSGLRAQFHDRDADPPFLLIDRESIQLNPEADVWVDVWEFEGAVNEKGIGIRGQGSAIGEWRSRISEQGSAIRDQQSAILTQQSSIALFRGPFLAGFSIPDSVPFEEWLILKREQLHQQALRILRRLADYYESCGEYEQALIVAHRQVDLEPWLEEAHRQIMRLLALNGQGSEALAQYEFCKRTLAHELGIEPAAETTRLYETIRAGRLEDIRRGVLLPFPGEPPYKGLRFFDEPDVALFFGREILTAQLVRRIREITEVGAGGAVGASLPDHAEPYVDQNGSPLQFLAVVGASGSGKSSLVRAGLVPALKQDGWQVEVFTPTAHPLEVFGEGDRAGLDSGGRGGNRIWVIDQFEELFTLCRSEEERAEFLDCLLTPAPSPALPHMKPIQTIGHTNWGGSLLPLHRRSSDGEGWGGVVLVLRADFYSHCAQYPLLRQAMCARQEYIGPMTDIELRQAIEQPALLNGWKFEPGLVDLILRDVGVSEDHPPEPGALPLLEHALLETWQRRVGRTLTLQGYADAGGVHGAIARTAESVFAKLTPEQQALARRIFLRLTELGEGTQDTRRRAPLSELSPTGEDTSRVTELLQTLADARLITLSKDTAEVAHEALIREWPALRQWLSEDRDGLRLHRHLTDSAQAWAALECDAEELYRGARLAQAQEWAEGHTGDLNTLEREFLQASQAQAERETAEREAQRQHELEAARQVAISAKRLARTQRQRSLVLSAGLLIAIALGLLSFGFYRQSNQNLDTARANASIALGRQALAQALVLPRDSDTNFIRSGLFIVESLQRAPGLDVSDAVQHVAGSLGSPVSRMAHEYLVNAVAFSPDGLWVMSGSADGTARVWWAESGKEIARMEHEGSVTAVAFNPDGSRVVSGSADGTARVWWAESGIEIARMTHTGSVRAVAFSPDGRYVVSGSADGTARVWKAENGDEIARKEHDGAVNAVAFSPITGYSVVSGSYDGTLLVWVAATGEEISRMKHEKTVTAVAFSPDGRYVVSGSVDGTARVWNATTGKEAASKTHEGNVTAVAFSPDGLWVVSGSLDGTARVWNAASGDEVARMTYGKPVYTVAFSPDGRWVASGSADGSAQVLEVDSGVQVAWLAHEQLVSAVTFSPSGNWVATGSYDRMVRVWRVTSGIEVARMTLDQPVASLAFSPDGRWVAAGGDAEEGMAMVWEAATGKEVFQETPGRLPIDVAFSPDSRWLATTGYYSAEVWDIASKTEIIPMSLPFDGRVVAFSPDGRWVAGGTYASILIGGVSRGVGVLKVWDLAKNKLVATMEHGTDVTGVAFSPDGNRVVTGCLDGNARVWETVTGDEVARMEHGTTVTAVAYSPDGRWVVSGSADGAAIVWNAATGEEVARGERVGGVNDVAFSPDGRWVVSASNDGTARVWQANNGSEIARMEHDGAVTSVAFSPDGQWVVSGSTDGTVRVWEAATGFEMTRKAHEQSVNAVAFSPDGHWVASGSYDKTVRVWIWQPQDMIALLCARLPRNFTQDEWKQFFGVVQYHQTCENLPKGE